MRLFDFVWIEVHNMCVTLALQIHVLGSLGFRVSPARFHMNDAVLARLDKVRSPLWVDELRAPNQSISTCAVFESGMWSVASERATRLDHPRDVFGMCVGQMSRPLIPSAPSFTTAKCNTACRVGKRSAKKHLEQV